MTFRKGDPNINRKGRPKNPYVEELREALIAVEEETRQKFAKRYVKRAFEKDIVMMDLAKKLYPDLIQQETSITQAADIEKVKEEFVNDINTRIEKRESDSSGAGSTEAGTNGSDNTKV